MVATRLAGMSVVEKRQRANESATEFVRMEGATVSPVAITLDAMTGPQLREYLSRKYPGTGMGSEIPLSWTVDEICTFAKGYRCPKVMRKGKGTDLPGAVRKAAEQKYGASLPTGWTGKELFAFLHGHADAKTPRGAVVKKSAVAAFVAKFNVEPPKSYGADKIVAATKAETFVPRTAGKRADGLTADACKKMLSQARKDGMKVPAYSALKADELRALVAELKLV